MDNKEELDSELDKLIAEATAEREENNDADSGENNEGKSDDSTDNFADNSGDSNDNSGEENSDDKSEEKKDETTGDENSEESSYSKEFKPVEVKFGNSKITLDSEEEVAKYLENQKNQIPVVKENATESMVKQAKISNEELALLADIKAGKPGAMKELARLNKIDLADAEDSEGDYKAEFKVEEKSEMDKAVDSISADAELAPKFNNVLSTVPDDFIESVSSNAADLLRFAGHVKSGIAEELIPLATKASALNGKSLLENYIEIGEQRYLESKESKKETKTESKEERQVTDKEKKLRERASSDADSNKSTGSSTADDIWNMSPEEMNLALENGEINLRD